MFVVCCLLIVDCLLFIVHWHWLSLSDVVVVACRTYDSCWLLSSWIVVVVLVGVLLFVVVVVVVSAAAANEMVASLI